MGEMAFGVVTATLDCAFDKTKCDVSFDFTGSDEGDQVSGNGWAEMSGPDTITGEIEFQTATTQLSTPADGDRRFFSSLLGLAPRHEVGGEFLRQDVGGEAENRNGDDTDEHAVDEQGLPRAPDEIADADARGDEFGGDEDDECDAEAEAQTGEDRRQRGRAG